MLLRFARAEMVQRDAQPVFDIASRLGEALTKVRQAPGFDPRLGIGPAVEAALVNLRREHLHER